MIPLASAAARSSSTSGHTLDRKLPVGCTSLRSVSPRPVSSSVIVASYNQPNSLALVLTGVLNQTHPIGELLIADDGSNPDTPKLVDEFAARDRSLSEREIQLLD